MGRELYIINKLNTYFESDSILKDMIPTETIDLMISELRTEYNIFYTPGMRQFDYDPEYVAIKKTHFDDLCRRDGELSDLRNMLFTDFNIPLASGISDISYTEFVKSEIKERVSNSIKEENKEKDRIESIRESVCKLLGISDCTGWKKIQTIIEQMTD